MTHEQKPESAEFRTREAQLADLAFHISDWKTSHDNEDITIARTHILEAEARGAAEQRRKDAEGIEEAKDEGANFVLTSLAVLFGKDGFEIRDGSETWEGDVHATLEGILEAGGLIDDEGDIRNVAALEARVKELEGEVKEEQRIANLRAEVIDNLTNCCAALEQEKHEAAAAERERCAKLCEALAQNISHERGSLPDWETGEVTLDELSQVEFEAFERAAAAIREGGE